MTTATRIVVSIHTVRAAMAEWHARFQALPPEDRAARNAEQEHVTPEQFAEAASDHLFQMLQRHAEAL